MAYSLGAIPIPSRSNSSLVASVASPCLNGGRFGLGFISFVLRVNGRSPARERRERAGDVSTRGEARTQHFDVRFARCR